MAKLQGGVVMDESDRIKLLELKEKDGVKILALLRLSNICRKLKFAF